MPKLLNISSSVSLFVLTICFAEIAYSRQMGTVVCGETGAAIESNIEKYITNRDAEGFDVIFSAPSVSNSLAMGPTNGSPYYQKRVCVTAILVPKSEREKAKASE